MRSYRFEGLILSVLSVVVVVGAGCGNQPIANTANANRVTTNTNSASANTALAPSGTVLDAREPSEYEATVKLTIETLGQNQNAALPAIGANIARSGEDRVMEFTLPNNEKVIYLEKGNMNYVVLPNRKQYAELTAESLGFEVRRLMMPEQIVNQVRAIPGVTLVGDENFNGRPATKYSYKAVTDTRTQAGEVGTDSFVLVDKETGLPLRSETVSQSQSGASVQGVRGLRVVTEISDIKTSADSTRFELPAGFQKIDPEQVKAQATLVFQTIAAVVGQLANQAQTSSSPTAQSSPSPAMSPAR